MRTYSDVAMVRYRPPLPEAPCERRSLPGGGVLRVLHNGQVKGGYAAYTDNPHLKSRTFHDRLGLYREKVPMTVMELEFIQRVATQKDIKVGYIDGTDFFRHIGAEHSFNPGVRREALASRISSCESRIQGSFPDLHLAVKHALRARHE